LNAIDRPSKAIQNSPEQGYVFSGFRLEPDGTLYRGQSVIHLAPKELAALRYLLAHAGQVVTTAQLREALWGDVHVTDDSVPKCLSSLRARLAPDESIHTVYKRGYRLSAEVRGDRWDPAAAVPRLAVLPFETGGGIPAHLGLAIVEEAIDAIVNMRPAAVTVLARDSVFTLAQSGRTAEQIGQVLRADLVLMGALRALPAHFRLRARMIRIADGAEIWVEDFLVEKSRIAGLAAELVDRLAFRIGSGEIAIAAAATPEPTDSTSPQRREAYEIYLRARYERQTLERYRMQDGLQHLLRATELDPSLASAQVDLANLCCTQSLLGFMSPGVAADSVRLAAATIPEFSTHAEAVLPAVGWVRFHVDRDLSAAAESFSRSAHLPDTRWSLRMRVMFALSRRRFDEAIGLLADAIGRDPFSPFLCARMAWALFLSGNAAESVEQIHQGLSRFPAEDAVALYGAPILSFTGDTAHGLEIASEFAQRHPYLDIGTALHAYALVCAHRLDEARAMLQRLQWMSRERFVLRSFTPAVYVALGEYDNAIAELRAAEECRCPWFFQMLCDPRLQALEGHAEFDAMQAILPRMEAAVEQEAAS
jgi:DNA-binding winged helix-turn-helix (wHTH) protein